MALGGAERGEGGERAFSEVVGVGYGPGHVLGLGELGPARRTRDRASAAAFGLCVGGGAHRNMAAQQPLELGVLEQLRVR